MEQPTSQPLYALPQQKWRAIIPKTLLLILLGVIFYLAVLLNVSLLEVTASTESLIKTISLTGIIILVTLGIITAIINGRKSYYFYSDSFSFGKMILPYSEIKFFQKKQNVADKLFKTYYLQLTKKVEIKFISLEIDLQNYIEKLVAYSQNRAGKSI